jgi:hypothetical protein
MFVAWIWHEIERRPSLSPLAKEKEMARLNLTPHLAHTEEALTVLFCLIDDAYAHLNPHAGRYESIKRLSDSEVITLALLQQLRGVESERSFLGEAKRFFSHLFPAVEGLCTPPRFIGA